MPKSVPVIIITAMISLGAFWVYGYFRTPHGLSPMGDNSDTIAIISLAVGVISMLATVGGFVLQIKEKRAARNRQ
tara:strand:+ start:398 stop:622 length:225 start_codon:yes stop_codon:yes gene_type:complete